MLTFVIPIRHPSTIAEPQVAKRLMAETLASVAAQTHPDWSCVIAAEEDADLPDLPPKVTVIRTAIPAPDLPDIRLDKRTNRQLVRMDKGARIMTALVAAQPRGHVMVVDYDDLVSRRLAELCAAEPEAAGWFFDSGWLYSGGAFMSAYPERFSRLCGTSIIVHSRLLKIPRRPEDIDFDYAGRTLGDHIFIRPDLEETGVQLERLAFPGAVYRMGHANSASFSVSMLGQIFNTANMRAHDDVLSRLKYFRRVRALGEIVQGLKRVRPLNRSLKREFFGAA